MNKRTILFISFSVLLSPLALNAQSLKAERVLHQNILKTIRDDIKENYYDPDLRGIDIEANFKKTRELIENAKSSEEMTDMIARFLYPFDDSHLYFFPPRKTVQVDYGWELLLVGEKVFVSELNKKSDAFEKGIRVGDQIYMIEGFIPTRREFSLLRYHFEILRPRPALNIILIKPSGNKYRMEIKAKITEDSVFMPSTRNRRLEYEKRHAERTRRLFYQEIPGLTILKMPSFDLSEIEVNKMMDKVKRDEALILDLRGNGGGLLSALENLLGHFFDKRINVAKVVQRAGTYSFFVEPRDKKESYTGKLCVLIDSDSASAAEIFARVIQLEKRGTVIGDQSAGAVMPAKIYSHAYGLDTKIPYAVSITVADLVMKDGQRLEKIGVMPDETVLPGALDLANNHDPVLSRGAQLLGFQISPEKAGQIFQKDKH